MEYSLVLELKWVGGGLKFWWGCEVEKELSEEQVVAYIVLRTMSTTS